MKNQCLGFKILLSCFTVLLLFAHIDAEQVSASTETIEVTPLVITLHAHK